MVERWFRNLTQERIRRGVFRSVSELVRAISRYIEEVNQDSRPFVWTATPERIMAKFRRARATLDKMQSE